MRIIAIASQKGGVGKTAATANLAAALAERGKRVLAIDLDPQANLTTWYGLRDDEGLLLKALEETLGWEAVERLAAQTHIHNVSLIPSSDWLLKAEERLIGQPNREKRLANLLGRLGERWDYILMDCPPNLGTLTLNALTAARETLIPVQALAAGLDGLVQLLRGVQYVRGGLNPTLAIAGIFLSQVDGRTRHAQEVIARLRERFGSQVYQTQVRSNIRIAESYSFRQPVTVHDPHSHGAEDYRALANEMISQERKSQP